MQDTTTSWSFKEWYKKSGSELNERRRKRYQENKSYRARVLDQNRKSRRKLRETVIKEMEDTLRAKKIRLSSPWKEIDVGTDENHPDRVLVTVGALAKVLGRSKIGIRVLERRGVIPQTTYRSKSGQRLYTPDMILEIYELLKSKGMLEQTRSSENISKVLARIRLSDGSTSELVLFKIGWLAKAVGRAVVTMEQMERRGILPKTQLLLPANRRAYTADQIETVKLSMDKWCSTIRDPESKKALYADVVSSWKKLSLWGPKVKVLEIVRKERTKGDGRNKKSKDN